MFSLTESTIQEIKIYDSGKTTVYTELFEIDIENALSHNEIIILNSDIINPTCFQEEKIIIQALEEKEECYDMGLITDEEYTYIKKFIYCNRYLSLIKTKWNYSYINYR